MSQVELERAAQYLEEAEAPRVDSYEHIWGKAQEAYMEAHKALVACRRSGDMEGRKKALQIVVSAELLMGDTFDALQYAQDELAMVNLSSREDKKSRAFMIELVVRCLNMRGDTAGAVVQVQELIELQKELADKAGQAKALRQMASLRIQMDQATVAIELAQDAVKIFKELKDVAEEEETTRILSYAWVQNGQPQKAPGREEALRALEALTKALTNMDPQAWAINERILMKCGAYNQSDLDDVIKQTLNKNPDQRKEMRRFLEDQGIDVEQYGGKRKTVCNEMYGQQYYLNVRSSGMSYGPHFRCLNQAFLVGLENEQAKCSANVLKINDGDDNNDEGWEKDLQFNPGVLDGMLQSATTFQLL